MGERENPVERGFFFFFSLVRSRGLPGVRGYRNFEDLDIIRVRNLMKAIGTNLAD